MIKRLRIAWLAGVLALSLVACSQATDSSKITEESVEVSSVVGNESFVQSSTEDSLDLDESSIPEASENQQSKDPLNDRDFGLKNVKIDSSDQNLTEEQKLVLQYFDDDYLFIPDYEFIRRYPDIFEDAQVTIRGSVSQVLYEDNENYELLLWCNVLSYDKEWLDLEGKENEMILLKGRIGNSRYIENDDIQVFGRYSGVQTIDVNGQSMVVPVVEVTNICTAYSWRGVTYGADKFDYAFIKEVAEIVFGKDIEIREPIVGTDITENYSLMMSSMGLDASMYIVELEDQSNANFVKFAFSDQANVRERILDVKDILDVASEDRIIRYVEFSPDFEHYMLFTFNTGLQTLKIAYYDTEFNKIWEREFEETISAYYDYTVSNMYLTANNNLYIINMESGEDTYKPTYVGVKNEIRKLDDGILMISDSKSDGIMKCALSGEIIWTTNLTEDVASVNSVQCIDNRVVVHYETQDYVDHFVVVDKDTGTLIQDAVPVM